MRDAHATAGRLDAAVAAQQALMAEAAAREDYARHVVEELAASSPRQGRGRRRSPSAAQRLMQLEKSADEVRDADEILSGPNAPSPALSGLMRRLMRKADSGASVFQPLIEALDTALERPRPYLRKRSRQIKREMAFDPAELEQVEGRLFALRGAARKHHVTVDDLSEVLAQVPRGDRRPAEWRGDAGEARGGCGVAARGVSQVGAEG